MTFSDFEKAMGHLTSNTMCIGIVLKMMENDAFVRTIAEMYDTHKASKVEFGFVTRHIHGRHALLDARTQCWTSKANCKGTSRKPRRKQQRRQLQANSHTVCALSRNNCFPCGLKNHLGRASKTQKGRDIPCIEHQKHIVLWQQSIRTST